MKENISDDIRVESTSKTLELPKSRVESSATDMYELTDFSNWERHFIVID